jgi:CBS domain-containing protein
MSKVILILAANPVDTPRLRLDKEVREIESGLQRAKRRNEFELKPQLAPRPADVRRSMLDLRPNIVHFCGHGAGDDGIAFEDENGRAVLISTEALSGFFKLFSDSVHCVVLNACFSQPQAEAIAEHIGSVVGMKKEIGDKAAIEFAVAFYDALGAGETIAFAYELACNAIQWAGLKESTTPILVSGKRVPEEKSYIPLVGDYMDREVERFSLNGSERGVDYLNRLGRGEEDAYTVVDEERKLRGILTPSDIRNKKELYERDREIDVERVMTEKPYSVRETDSLLEALGLMNARGIITGLPVVDSREHLVGYISRMQLMAALRR